MAFTPEDGSGVAGANAYIEVTYADDHHGDRGNTAWAAGAAGDKQSAIIRATDYVDKRFGRRFRGFRQSRTQGLEWPRLSAFDNDDFLWQEIPDPLKKAVAEYALIALQLTDLLPIPARPFSHIDPTTGEVVSTVSGQARFSKEKVGPVEETTSYSDNSALINRTKPSGSSSTLVTDFNLPEYPVADEWLQELVKSSYNVELRRA